VSLKTPISLTSSSWFHGMPGMSSSTWPSAYGAIYRQHLWVAAVVNKRANAVARLPLPVYRRDELNRPRADDHPLAVLLSNPNPALSGFDLWVWTQATRDIFGEAFWLKKRRGGAVVALYPLHPASMEWVEKDAHWKFDNGSLKLDRVADSDLVHFRSFNPDSMTRGMSPLEPLRSTLENEWHARNATSSFWQRGARPGTALVHPKTLSADAQTRLKAQYDAIAAGSGNTGATVVLEEGLKPEKMTLTAEEAQYVETRKLNREEVCGAYDVPPPVVHILDHATFSNITEQMRSMYRDTMAPVLKGLEATIDLDLRQAEWPQDEVYAEFLMDEVLRGDFEARATAYRAADYMTMAEKRKSENLPFIEGTDRIFLNTATLPLDVIDANASADAEPPELPDNVIPFPVARSVMGRLSWQKTLRDVDAAVLTVGLDDDHAKSVVQALGLEMSVGGDVPALRERIRSMAKE